MSLITNVEPLKWDGSTLTRRTLGCKKTFLACGMMRKKTKKMPSLHNFLNGNTLSDWVGIALKFSAQGFASSLVSKAACVYSIQH